jgi:hypothetical protein
MHANSQATPLSRPVRLALIALASAVLLAGAPRITHTGPLPSASPAPATPVVPEARVERDALLALVASLDRPRTEPGSGDGHALRRPVAGYAVRLAVDPRAIHPLDGRLEARPSHLGAPGQVLRRVALAAPAPEPEPAPAAPVRIAAAPAPAAPPIRLARSAPPALSTAVKISSPPAPIPAAPSPRQAGHGAVPVAGPGRSVLVAGDSLSIDLAEALRPLLAGRPGTAFAARGKVSSGLARPDFFDWEREMRQLAVANRPDTVLVMIATNDNQTLARPDGSRVAFGRPGWEAEYARRVRRLVELARTGNPGARIYWIGAPVMANPRLNADVAAINAVIRRQVEALPGCRFVDVWPTLADAAGHFTPSLPTAGGRRATRTPDGVHLTAYGARLLADACLASLSPAVAALGRP